MLEVELDQKKIDNIIKKLNNFGTEISNEKVLLQIALGVKNNILVKTNMGIDVNDKPFKPYSPNYAKLKKKTGTGWLVDTGLMLNSMTQKIINNNAVMIYFNNKDARIRAKAHNKGEGNLPQREFFGFSELAKKEAYIKYSEYVKSIKEKNDL